MSAVAAIIEEFDAIDWLYQPISREDLAWYEKQITFAKDKLAELLAKYHLNPADFQPMELHPYAVEESMPEAYYSYLVSISSTIQGAYKHHFREWFLPPDPMPRQFECWPPSVQRMTGQTIGVAFDRPQQKG